MESSPASSMTIVSSVDFSASFSPLSPLFFFVSFLLFFFILTLKRMEEFVVDLLLNNDALHDGAHSSEPYKERARTSTEVCRFREVVLLRRFKIFECRREEGERKFRSFFLFTPWPAMKRQERLEMRTVQNPTLMKLQDRKLFREPKFVKFDPNHLSLINARAERNDFFEKL